MLRVAVAVVTSAGFVLTGSAAAQTVRPAAANKAPVPKQCQGAVPGDPSQQPTTNLTALDPAKIAYSSDPALASTQLVTLTVRGFAPAASVAVRLANTTATSYHPASATGVLTYKYLLKGLGRGQYRLLFQGAFPPAAGARPSGGNLEVGVPRIGIFPFRVACGGAEHPAVQVTKASLSAVVAGKKITLTGWVTPPGSSKKIAGLPVTLWRSTAGGTWQKLATGKTASSGKSAGTIRWVEAPAYNTRYELRYGGGKVQGVAVGAVTSKVVTMTVPVHVSVSIPRSVRHGVKTAISVTLTALKGRLVYLQVDGKNTASGRENAKGTVTFTVAFTRGSHTVRVYVPASTHNAKTYSPTVKIKVS